MQEDKILKELLSLHAMEQCDDGFTAHVMRRIEAANKSVVPLLHKRLRQFLIFLFAGGCLLALGLGTILPQTSLPTFVPVALSQKVYSQALSFLIIFWAMMLLNHIINSRRKMI